MFATQSTYYFRAPSFINVAVARLDNHSLLTSVWPRKCWRLKRKTSSLPAPIQQLTVRTTSNLMRSSIAWHPSPSSPGPARSSSKSCHLHSWELSQRTQRHPATSCTKLAALAYIHAHPLHSAARQRQAYEQHKPEAALIPSRQLKRLARSRRSPQHRQYLGDREGRLQALAAPLGSRGP